MATITGIAQSPNVQRAVLIAYELGIDFTFVTINLFKGETKTPSFLARNPFGEMPIFENGNGVVIFESRAIARYLDVKSGGKLLHLSNPDEYALVENWTNVEEQKFDKYAYELFLETPFKTLIADHLDPKENKTSQLFLEIPLRSLFGQRSDAEKVASLKTSLFLVLDVYEKQLATRKYIAGNSLSIADLFHLPGLTYVYKLIPSLFENYPNVKKWYDDISSRPSWKKTLDLAK